MNTLPKLVDYLKSTYNEPGKEIVDLQKKQGERGAWFLIILANGDTASIPCGGSEVSQKGKIADYNVIMGTQDGKPIATVSNYTTEETMSFGVAPTVEQVEPIATNVQTDDLPF